MATHILLNLKNQQSFSSSPSDIFKSILEQLNEWITFIPNLFRSLVAKFDEAFPPETRARWLAVAAHFAVIALGVVLLCLIFCCFGRAIIMCITWVIVAIWNLICGFIMLLWIVLYNVTLAIWKLIRGFISLLWRMIESVYRVCCCCGRGSMKMMKAPGTGGLLTMPRALFQSNPAAYFSGLRAGRLPLYVS